MVIVPGTGQGHGQVNQLMRHRGRGLIQFYFQHRAPAEQRTIYLYFVLFCYCFLVFFSPLWLQQCASSRWPPRDCFSSHKHFLSKSKHPYCCVPTKHFCILRFEQRSPVGVRNRRCPSEVFFHAAVTQTQSCVLVLVTHHITCPTPVIPHHFPEIYRFQISGGGNG